MKRPAAAWRRSGAMRFAPDPGATLHTSARLCVARIWRTLTESTVIMSLQSSQTQDVNKFSVDVPRCDPNGGVANESYAG